MGPAFVRELEGIEFMKAVSTGGRSMLGVAAGLMLALAGCQSGDGGGGFLGMGGATQKTPAERAAEDGKVLASDLIAYCPRVTLREGTAYFTTYARGGDGDKSKIVYQAAITDVTRSCTRSNGQLVINVAVAGRVVPGPLGTTGTITMPIRVVVTDSGNVAYTQLHQFPVQIGSTAAATQFIFNDPNVALPEPRGTTLQVMVGYDEGPPPKQTARRN